MSSQRQHQEGSSVTLEPVVADAVAATGFDLEQLNVSSAGRRRLIKVVVDSDDGVGLDNIAEVSRAVSAALDAHDPHGTALGGPYTLEVTSPGLDRPLTKPRHWRRTRFRLVKVKQTDGTRFTGRVGDTYGGADGGVELLVDGQLRRIGYADVERAVVEVEFSQAPAEDLAKLGGSERDVEEEPR